MNYNCLIKYVAAVIIIVIVKIDINEYRSWNLFQK